MADFPPTTTPPDRRPRRSLLHLVLAALLAGGLALGILLGTAGTNGAGRSAGTALSMTTKPLQGAPVTWMLSVGALERIDQAGLPASLVSSFFDRRSTILLGATGAGSDPLAPHAQAAADFTSATALIQALADHRVPASVPDLVLDLEAWPLTPIAEQHDPIAAALQALHAAQAAGKRLIFTPGVDLVRVLTGQHLRGPALLAAYDRLLAGPGAKVSDVFEVQAQGTEGTSDATSFTRGAVQAAQTAHPGVPVLVGLSTNPSGRRVTPADLLQVAEAARAAGASGFWLNVPEAGAACPRCGQPEPEVAVAFLEQLAHGHGPHPGASSSPVSSVTTARGSLLDPAGQLLAANGHPADWILAASQFAAVVGQPGVARLMGGGTVFEPVSPRQAPSGLLPVTPTLVVHSEGLLANEVAAGQVPGDIRAVLYDNERFPDTPSVEQADPLAYDQRVAALAAEHHWVSICDLIEPDRLPADQRTPKDEVPPCTIIGLNTVQQSERQPVAYEARVARALATIHAVRPDAIVLAGLSANPRGGPVTAAELAGDIEATRDLVQGYWLNVPSPGIGCPACGQPDPGLMAAALQLLAH
jgi:hypothetical protein